MVFTCRQVLDNLSDLTVKTPIAIMRRSSTGLGPVQVPVATMTSGSSPIAAVPASMQCRHHFDISGDARSSRPPPSRPSFLSNVAPSSTSSSSVVSQQLPPRSTSQRSTAWKRSSSGSDVNDKHRSRFISCVSGQRSPASPDEVGAETFITIVDVASVESRTGDIEGKQRSGSLPMSQLENGGLNAGARRPPLSSTSVSGAHTLTSPKSSSNRRFSLSRDKNSVDKNSLNITPSETRVTDDVKGDQINSMAISADAKNSDLEPRRGRSRDTVSKDRKKRVVGDRSPAVIWRSISSSSLVRSLSRRRSKNYRRSVGSGSDMAGGTCGGSTTSDDCRSKMSSSVDTEDSDADILDVDGGGPRRARHQTITDAISEANDTPRLEERRQSDAAVVINVQKNGSRRRSFFSRSFRRSRSTPAEEFVCIASTIGGNSATLDRGKAETERLPRKRLSCRNVVSGNEVNRLTLSSRAASWASLKRSVTSESLSSVSKGQNGSAGCDVTGANSSVYVVAVLKLTDFMLGKWISAMAFNADRRELVVVDFRGAYVIDVSGCGSGGDFRLVRRVVGSKGLIEPIGVSCGGSSNGLEGRLVFSDRADQSVKVYSGRGSHIRSVGQLGLSNVGGVAVDAETGDVFVAGTDSRRVVACRRAAAVNGTNTGNSSTLSRLRKHQHQQPDVTLTSTPEVRDGPLPVLFQHPYSVAVNPVNGDVIVGDDYAQEVVAVPCDGRSVRWRWVPPKSTDNVLPEGSDMATSNARLPQRPFFPSSICADASGHVFVADLYNERVYMLDCSVSRDTSTSDRESLQLASESFQRSRSPPDCSSPLLTKRTGLRGGPLSLAVDESRHQLYVADEERTVRIFCYAGAVTAAASRRRTASETQDEIDGKGTQRHRQNQSPHPANGHLMSAVDKPFSYCTDDGGKY